MRWAVVVGCVVVLGGCATSFTGSAKVRHGPAGCRKVCESWEMELAGMVQMGEYSDGCICQVKAAAADARTSAGAPTAAAVGVYLQMQAAAEANRPTMSGGAISSPPGSPGWRPGTW